MVATLDHPVASPGELVTQHVVARNTGALLLLDVRVTSNIDGTCTRYVSLLLPGGTVTLDCRAAATTSRTVTGAVSAIDLLGGPVGASSADQLQVVHPSIAVRASVSPAQVVPGEHVDYTVVVTNTGDATLTGVVLTAQGVTCPAVPGTLAAGASATVRCGTTAQATGTARFTATAKDVLGTAVSGTSSTGVTVLHPALTMSVTAPPGPVKFGTVVPVTVLLRNTGQVALTDLRVTGTPAACQRTIPALAVGATQSYTCPVTVTGRTDVRLSATAIPAIGGVSVGSTFAVTQTGALVLVPGAAPVTPPPPTTTPPVTTVAPPPAQVRTPPPVAPATPPRKVVTADKGPLKSAPATTAAVIGVLGVLVMTVSVGAFTAAGRPR